MTPVMIDRQGSLDRDDALHVTRSHDGWTVTVHIANVPAGVTPGGTADIEARRHGHTRYGATATRHMLPPALVRRLTLAERTPRASIALTLQVAGDGSVTGYDLARRRVTNLAAMTHEEVAAALNDPQHAHHEMLTHAAQCAHALHDHRRTAGALAVYDLVRGWATDEDGQLVRLDQPDRNIAYIIVQECMIAANSAVAAWAVQQDLPILFRNHMAATAAPTAADLATDIHAAIASQAPGQLDAARQRLALVMRAATYGPTVRGHYALTLPAYTHVTSPLRRYADLITLRQVLAALDGDSPPYRITDLEVLAAELNAAAAEERARKSAALKERAHRAARATATAGTFSHLPPARFSAVLKRATAEGLFSAPLDAEVRRRAESGALALADIAHVLAARGDTWRPLHQALIERVAAEPHTAPSLLSIHTVSRGMPAVAFTCEVTGQSPKEVFTARASCGGVSGAPRRAASKKAAQHRAGVSLLAALAAVDDPSTDAIAETRSAPSMSPSAPPPVVAGQHPVSVLNEYQQRGRVSTVRWDMDRAGPPHNPTFTAWAHAEVPGRGELRASGEAASKVAARERAAGALLRLIGNGA
ncbi:hypothetical protein C1I98_13490 [Spongiactinospora gelatinilytica]|uniref:DRBM domain-containing protein n=1 Tax=Spongiactinospora gelatinilytica TaxID=2666298 RepID=A0A2W2HD15_9ACTN|nr:RNB domain-containing ribonuclease [Spongiactinospora gelatinilytica]PZG47478.1 hypothetical protein C1I98_13490 [Spongiactinospora gelatinilytica]